ncbi:MAG: DPP IV N-terminal domain-containing protein [Alistipes sp.]|nr:DPP IV N-terminal domain-containing protein [Alistipes sp.]MBR2368018.1 DPP IV N-terminal domain-containing protein [Alistipes sp.]
MVAISTLSAQVSYLEMVEARNANPDYIHPASLTPLPGTNQYMELDGKRVVLYDYDKESNGEVVFSSDNLLMSYVKSPDGTMALYEKWDGESPRKEIYRHSFTSDYYIACPDGSTIKIDDVRDISFSPDSKYLAMGYNNDIFIYELATNKIYNITDDGKWNYVINGTTDWVYEEEYGFTKAYAFSPDSKEIAYLKFDESQVKEFEMMRFDNELYNKAYSFKYPKAGDNNSIVTLHVYNIESKQTRQIDTGEHTDQYIPRIGYTPAGKLFFYRVNRLQNHFEVVQVEADGSQRVIYNEMDERYVERPNDQSIIFIDEEHFIAREETTTGWFHLYLHSVNKGRLNAITSGEWEVTQFVGVAKNGKQIYYMSTEQSPLERHLYSINLDGSDKKCLLSKPGYWRVYPSDDMSFFAAEHSATDCYPTAAVYNAKGKQVRSLMIDEPTDAVPAYQRNYYTFTTERGDELQYYLIYPENFNPSKSYPVLLTQYSGPGSQQIENRWTTDWEETLARNGYIVACCDARGTGFRGEDFKKVTYANLGHCEVEDQLSFARHLASQSFIDAERIGIYGWSYGGFMALGCSLKGDGLFKMAIAVAPVTSWRYYDSIYTEIYNGLPQDNPAGYDDNSPLNFADRLSNDTRLLIIHGTADDNVHFQNTIEMCRALNRAGKQYDMMVYPDQNHSMRPDDMINIRQKMVDYCLEYL